MLLLLLGLLLLLLLMVLLLLLLLLLVVVLVLMVLQLPQGGDGLQALGLRGGGRGGGQSVVFRRSDGLVAHTASPSARRLRR